jgi:hypothetical protein
VTLDVILTGESQIIISSVPLADDHGDDNGCRGPMAEATRPPWA